MRRPTVQIKVNHLEVLHHVCQRKHWRMKLSLRYEWEGRTPDLLDVVDKEGELVGRITLTGGITPHQAAEEMLDGLQRGGLVP